MQQGKRITTVEGLERDGKLHPVQAAFIEHDGFELGLPGVFPPLKDSAVVTAADPTEHIRIVLRGLSGKAIGGVTYGSAMPAFADQLTDEEVAAVVSHERTNWRHEAKPVKPEDVLAQRRWHEQHESSRPSAEGHVQPSQRLTTHDTGEGPGAQSQLRDIRRLYRDRWRSGGGAV